MTIFDLLLRMSSGTAGLIAFLERVAEKAPDLGPKAQELIAALTQAASMMNLVTLASVLPGEIANIAQGKLDARDHPSDGV